MRTIHTDNERVLAILRESLRTGKPMEPVRITVTEGEDPVVKGVVMSMRATGNGWFIAEIKP